MYTLESDTDKKKSYSKAQKKDILADYTEVIIISPMRSHPAPPLQCDFANSHQEVTSSSQSPESGFAHIHSFSL